MSMKSEYLLQFPIQQTEEKCMINPMHLEPAVTIAMGEHNAPVCLVCDQNKNTMMIATWEPDNLFTVHQSLLKSLIVMIWKKL